ncbi:MAG: hypothetical protein FJ008_08845 [Chloroflexi bacterium]|nr:hypothetical protein [Chloroflexota bacterium]
MIEFVCQLWRSFKRAITRGHRKQTSIVLHPASLRHEKLPKIVRDEETGMVHEFVFTEAQLSRAKIFRETPYPKVKRDAHGQATIQSSWRAS